MPPITQDRKQYVVSLPTFMGWLRVKREHEDARIIEETGTGGLLAEAGGRRLEVGGGTPTGGRP